MPYDRRVLSSLGLSLLLIFGDLPVRELTEPKRERVVYQVRHPGTPIFTEPTRRADRIGAFARGTRFYGGVETFEGFGCSRGFIQEADGGYVCLSHLRQVDRPTLAESLPVLRDGQLVPSRHAFVLHDATPVYEQPEDALFGAAPIYTLSQGFGIVIAGSRVVEGERFMRLRDGNFVSRESLGWSRPSEYEGHEIGETDYLDFAFAKGTRAAIRDESGARVRWAERREVVRVPKIEGDRALLSDGTWMSVSDLHIPRFMPPPDEVFSGEIFIDIDLTEQMLIVYRGSRPIFATLVSTGRASTPTREGVFPIWVKLAETDMSNLRDEEARSHYLMEGVPWAQFFDSDIGLHAVYWHNDFGRPRSNGCVNLSPRDAKRIFELTRPSLPAGYEAILRDSEGRPTLVRVRR